MDDERLEEMLRQALAPRTAGATRTITLRRQREELAKRRPSAVRGAVPRWQLACAAAGILWILAAGAADHCRQARLAAMTGSPDLTSRETRLAQERLLRMAAEWHLAGVPGTAPWPE